MATLRFSFGTMGSGKSTMALQIHHNLASRQLFGLLLTTLDREGAQVTSRLGVAAEAVEVVAELDLYQLALDNWPLHYLVCDEAQFYTEAQCDQLARVVDDLGVDVFAFGLITDFRGLLFDGTKRLLEVADERVPMQVEARCWCGARATHNARSTTPSNRPVRARRWWWATPVGAITNSRCSATRCATSCCAVATTQPARSVAERCVGCVGHGVVRRGRWLSRWESVCSPFQAPGVPPMTPQ